MFRPRLTHNTHARIGAIAREMERLHSLTDRWLAEELLRLARAARRECGVDVCSPHWHHTYPSAFLWHVVPRVARLLGAAHFLPNEDSDPELHLLHGGPPLRHVVGLYLQHTRLPKTIVPRIDPATPDARDILGHVPANGNPVAMALDRLATPAPPGADVNDFVARHMREVTAARGFAPTPTWSPVLQRLFVVRGVVTPPAP
jgi:hypothetical protein